MGLFSSLGKKPIEQIMKEGVKSEAELKQLIVEACSRGAVHAKLYLDAHGPDKKATEDVLLELVAKVVKEKSLLYGKGEIESSVEAGKLYSSFAVVEVVSRDFSGLLTIFLKYAPAGVELIEPPSLTLSMKQMQDILLDASQVSQQYATFIHEKAMTTEQKVDFAERLKRKAEFGAKLREKAQAKTEKKIT